MTVRTLIAIRATASRMKYKLINWLLGPAARAGQFVADADARLIGLRAGRPASGSHAQTPFFNRLQVIDCA